jgi:hypothetical protein
MQVVKKSSDFSKNRTDVKHVYIEFKHEFLFLQIIN